MSQQDTIRLLMKIIYEACQEKYMDGFTGETKFRITWNEGRPYPRLKQQEEETKEVKE